MRGLHITLLLAGLVWATGGCATTIAVDLATEGERAEAFEGLNRFAVIHSPTGDRYSRRLAEQTVEALGTFATRRGYQPISTQQPLTVSRDDNDMIHRLGALAVRSFRDAGYRHDARDPKFVISVEFATGPFDYHVPSTVARRESAQAVGARNDRAYAHAVLIHIYDVRQPDQPIWQGTAITVMPINDFARLSPLLIEELASAYPATTPAVRRTVTLR